MDTKKTKPEQKPRRKRPLTEEEIRRRRARKRREQKKRAIRRLAILLVLFVIVLAGLIAGITLGVKSIMGAFEKRSDETVLTVHSDGTLVLEEVSLLSEEYDAEGLKTYAKDQIKDFVPPEGEEVKLLKAEVNENQVYLKTEYSSPKAYNAFTGYEVFYGTISEAQKARYDFATTFLQTKETEASETETKIITLPADRESVIEKTDTKVFILRQNIKVTFDEKPAYISSEGTSIDKSGVTISATDGNLDAPPLAYIIFENTTKEGEK